MGRERDGARQYLYFCVAGLIIFVLAACVPVKKMVMAQERSAHLQRVRHLISQGDFESASQENEKVLSLSPKSPPGDAALFSEGLIYLHDANPTKDYQRALRSFAQLEREFPESPLTAEAKIWLSILEAMEDKNKTEQERRPYLQRVRYLISQGDFAGALQENKNMLSLSSKSPPRDAALFGQGLIHLHYANPERDYQKALSFFEQLAKEFPESPLMEEAKVWMSILEALENKVEQKRDAHLQRVPRLVSQGDFEGALQENQKALSLSPQSPPGDAALFSMGLAHVHYANPKKDYRQALGFFAQVANKFPQSPFTEEAKVWVGVLEAIEKTRQIDIEIEEKKKELAR